MPAPNVAGEALLRELRALLVRQARMSTPLEEVASWPGRVPPRLHVSWTPQRVDRLIDEYGVPDGAAPRAYGALRELLNSEPSDTEA